MQVRINDKRTNDNTLREVYEFSHREKETVIRFDQESGKWCIWSNIQSHITKCFKVKAQDICIESINRNGTITSISAKLNKPQISFRNNRANK